MKSDGVQGKDNEERVRLGRGSAGRRGAVLRVGIQVCSWVAQPVVFLLPLLLVHNSASGLIEHVKPLFC